MTISAFAFCARNLVFLLLTGLCLAPIAEATVYRVKQVASGAMDGSTWADCLGGLDAGLSAATLNAGPDEIWVAADVAAYAPNATTGFSVTNQVAIYGGFRGNEISVTTRAGLFSQTKLDGVNSAMSFQADHVINVSGVTGPSTGVPGVTIDGFTITGGLATTLASPNGGGIYSVESDLRVKNCFIQGNVAGNGAGLYFRGGTTVGSSNLLLIGSTRFADNYAILAGGGLYAETVYGQTANVSFVTNGSDADGGGVFLTKMGSSNTLEFMNAVFFSNIATNEGAGMMLGASGSDLGRAFLANCTFNRNSTASTTGPTGGAITTSSSSVQATFKSSIVWDNTPSEWAGINSSYVVTYSDFKGGAPVAGTGNIAADPLFQNAPLGRLRLTADTINNPPSFVSPCIDEGSYCIFPVDTLDVDNDGVTTGETVDVDADFAPRPINSSVTGGTGDTSCSPAYNDMGAYEFQS